MVSVRFALNPSIVLHQLEVGVAVRLHFVRRQQVRLVENQHDGRLALLLDQLGDLLILRRGHLRDINHEQNHIGVGDALGSRLNHELSQLVARLMDTGRVHEDDLGVGPSQDAAQTMAGGLRLGRDDGYLLPQPGVDEGRFTHVGLADHRHEPGAVTGRRLVVQNHVCIIINIHLYLSIFDSRTPSASGTR